MDAIVSILPQTQGANGVSGATAPDAAEAGVFASLLAGQTAPIAPVPAIPSRPNGGNAFAASTTAESASMLSSMPQTPTGVPAGAAIANTDPAATASLPASPTTGAQASRETANMVAATATTPDSASGAAAAMPGSAAAVIGGQSSVSTLSPSTVVPEPGVDSAVTGKTGTAQPASANGAASPLPEGGDKSAVKTNMADLPNGPADGSPKSNEAAQLAQTANGAQISANPTVAQPSAANTTIATAAATLPPAPVQAGVQVRREASGPDKMQSGGTSSVSKSTVSNAASSPTASASASAVKPETVSPPPPPTLSQTPAPPVMGLPAEAARLALGDAARAAPPPIDAGQSDPAAETEQVDLSSLRAADASRTAERPGTAAGSARFTPATTGTLAAQIATKFQNGERRFEIRMDPPELGRIEVKLQVGNDNRVQAMLSAERPETLNDLRQYARELERALEESGLQLDTDGLSFELSQGEEDQGQNPKGSGRFSSLEFAEDLSGPITASALPRELYGFQLSAHSGVDIRL